MRASRLVRTSSAASSRGRDLAQGDHRSGLAGGVGRAADADAALLVAADDLQLDGQPRLGQDRGQAVRIGQRPAGRLDEQVALADPGTRRPGCRPRRRGRGGRRARLSPTERRRRRATIDGATAMPSRGRLTDSPRRERIDPLAERCVGGAGQVEALADPVRVEREEAAGRRRRAARRTSPGPAARCARGCRRSSAAAGPAEGLLDGRDRAGASRVRRRRRSRRGRRRRRRSPGSGVGPAEAPSAPVVVDRRSTARSPSAIDADDRADGSSGRRGR